MALLVRSRTLAHMGFLVLVFVAWRGACAQQKGATEGPVAFVDVNVVPMDSDRLLPHRTVITSGGRIVAIGPSRSVRIPKDAQRIDGKGRFLMPLICMCTSTSGGRQDC
jgi:hypothetical protein